MTTVLVPVDLENARATAGRRVSINVPVLYPPGATSSSLAVATARARQELQALLEDGRTSQTPLGDGRGADLGVTGRLLQPWSSTWALRQQAYAAVSRGADDAGVYFQGTGPEDVAILDLDEPAVERTLPGPGSWYTDPTGESNPDGTVNYDTVLRAGAREGLENFGEGVGAVAGGVGEGVSAALGGFFGGLGLGWSIVLVLVVVLAALLALSFAFGGPRLLP